MFIDSHCHLDYLDLAAYDGSLDALLQAARDRGVSGILSISVDRDNVAKVSAIASRYETIWGSVGIHCP